MITHMPFLFDGGMLFSSAEAVGQPGHPTLWKLHYCDTSGTVSRIDTGLPDNVVECSGSVYTRHRGGVALRFVGQIDGMCHFYVLYGKDIHHLTAMESHAILGIDTAHAGIVGFLLEAVGNDSTKRVEVARRGSLNADGIPYESLGLTGVSRLTISPDSPYEIFISGMGYDNLYKTLAYSHKTKLVRPVRLADGSEVYKGMVYGGKLAYAVRLSEEFEHREVKIAAADGWMYGSSSAVSTSRAIGAPSVDPFIVEQEAVLRANCARGYYCKYCRGDTAVRLQLRDLGIVDEKGVGCPKNLPWFSDVPDTSSPARRTFWCERFGAGVTSWFCEKCTKVRSGSDPDKRARLLMDLRDNGIALSCKLRQKAETKEKRKCCGSAEKEVSTYSCARLNRLVYPSDCRGCEFKERKTETITTDAGAGSDACGLE